MGRAPFSGIGLLLLAGLATGPGFADELKDFYFGEALFYAHQGQYFEALERLDSEVRQHGNIDEPQLDTLYAYINDAEFSLGDFELRYRMHHRAGRAITAVLEGAVDEVVRNDAAYRLARIHFQKNQADDALRALDRIDGEVPASIRDDIEFLRANIYLAQSASARKACSSSWDRPGAGSRRSRVPAWPRHSAAAVSTSTSSLPAPSATGETYRVWGPEQPWWSTSSRRPSRSTNPPTCSTSSSTTPEPGR
jgi:hypothetical protein